MNCVHCGRFTRRCGPTVNPAPALKVEGTDLTNFTVTATLAHARDVLADRRLFTLDDAAWSEFKAVLDRPVSAKPKLAG